jgi:hypothetical protein
LGIDWSEVNGLKNRWIIDKEMSEYIPHKNETTYFICICIGPCNNNNNNNNNNN